MPDVNDSFDVFLLLARVTVAIGNALFLMLGRNRPVQV